MKLLSKIILCVAALSLVACSNQAADGPNGGFGGKADDFANSDWMARVEREVMELQQDDSRLWRTLLEAEGMQTRKGFLRLRGKDLHHPKAASVFLHRYLSAKEAQERYYLVEALPRTGGLYEDAITELMNVERDDGVRAVMVGILAKGKTAKSVEGIAKGLGDKAASVRLEAAIAAGQNTHGASAGTALVGALADSDAAVRAASAKALGYHKVAGATDALAQRLGDGSAEVRLEALRAMSRIDRQGTASRADVAQLTSDSDARVRRVAERITRASL